MLCLGEPEKLNLPKQRKLSKKQKVVKLKAKTGQVPIFFFLSNYIHFFPCQVLPDFKIPFHRIRDRGEE